MQVTKVEAEHPRLLPDMIVSSLHRYGHLLKDPAILRHAPPPPVIVIRDSSNLPRGLGGKLERILCLGYAEGIDPPDTFACR
eukprot:15569386-Heterocapsa_arctica.AAC.1